MNEIIFNCAYSRTFILFAEYEAEIFKNPA